MSHEIRTLMNAVLGLAQLLELEDRPQPREWVRHILAAGQSLLAIINDILDFSKIERGQIHLESRSSTGCPAGQAAEPDGQDGSPPRLGFHIETPEALPNACWAILCGWSRSSSTC